MKITAKSQPILSAIIPARNEQVVIAACIASLAQQPEIAEIIVVNDQSTDATGPIVQELMKIYLQLRLIETTQLPSGWVGKNHAVYQGAREAKGDWLLFTDADVIHGPHSVHKALQIAGTQNAALISFSPEQLTESWHEKSLIPVIYSRLASKFSFDKINDPNNPAAAANGQFLLISREAYNAIGCHAAIAGEVLEDVMLAKKVKQAGYRIWFGSGKGIVRVRMYRSFSAMWEGWTKNLYRLMGSHPAAMLSEIFSAAGPILLAAIVTAAIWNFTRDWRAGLFTASVAFAAWVSRYRRELMYNQYSPRLVWYGIPGKLLYAGVMWASYRAHQKDSLSWKGREYPVGTPNASNDVSEE